MADLIYNNDIVFRIKDIRKIKKETVKRLPSILIFGYISSEEPEVITFIKQEERDQAFLEWKAALEHSKE